MRPLERALVQDGYSVVNLSYPSRQMRVSELSQWLHDALAKRQPALPLGFVTHSMGGLVMRAYLARKDALPTAAAVMIAPPNNGAVAADVRAKKLFYRSVLGPALDDLCTFAARPPPPPCPFAVIAGDAGAEHDGRVLVSETRLDGMAEHTIVRRRHTFIMMAPEVIEAARRFLATRRADGSSA